MRHIFLSLLLLAISTTFGALILEGVTRWKVGVPWPEQLPLVRVKADPDTGWIMLPEDIHYTYDKQVQLNTHGFRGPEIRAKLEDEFRILALGDSHIYGQGLKDESLITTVLSDSMKSLDLGCYFNVINMGVRAYSINNELAVLKKFGIPLKPDHVILFFYINDFQKTNIEQKYNQFADKDWYMFDLSDKLSPKVLREWNRRQIFRKSAFLMWTHDLYMGITNSNGLENRILAGLVDNEFKEANQFVEDSLSELVRLSSEYNFSVTLAVIPVAAQVANDYPSEIYQSTLQQHALKYSLDFVNLLPMLRNYYDKSGKLPVIPYDGHYDGEGHKAFGIAMAEHLHDLAISCKSRNLGVVSK